ncbi:MAG: hypothetical protein AAF548_07910 [Actinomycetota bacterium]
MTGRRLVVAALAILSSLFLALEIRDGWAEVGGEQFPGAGWLLAAVGVLALGQIVIGEAMATLPAEPTRASERRRAFHLTQPAKYVPAGIAQAAGVVVALVGRGATRPSALVVWAVHTGSLIVAGVAVGLLTAPALGWSPFVVVPGALVLAVVGRPIIAWVAVRVGRLLGASLEIPSAADVGRCFAAASVGVALHGLGFAALVRGAGLEVGAMEAVAAYTLAFGISVATPLPGGLGAREAIIVAVLAPSETVLIVPVVLVRLLLIAIEFALLVIARLGARG